MNKSLLALILLGTASLLVSGCEQKQVSFSQDVKPILDNKCLSCHDGVGEGSDKTDLLVTDYQSIMKGTKFGPVVVPGDSVSSTLYRVISHLASTEVQMPPHHETSLAEGRAEPLTDKEIATIKNWIDQGAKNN